MLDNGSLLKVAGFGLIRLSKISPEKTKLVQPEGVDHSSKFFKLECINISNSKKYYSHVVVNFDRSETSGDELEYFVCSLHERIHL